QKGIEKGREEGIQKGIEENKKQTVLNGHRNGISTEILCLLTGYSEVEVLQILAEEEDGEQA
ncbi:MAG: DUF4351 domain-containing protein, partial [Saprospiraceae bacterium]